MDLEEIKGKVDAFFTKKQITTEHRYFIAKALAEEYWESIRDDEPVDDDQDVLDDFEDDELELAKPIPVPKPPKGHKAGIASLIKKPNIPIK